MVAFAEKLANVVNRFEEIQALISSPNVSADDLVKMNKELSTLTPVVEAVKEYKAAEQNMNDAKVMMEDASLDKEMRELAEAEYFETKDEKELEIIVQFLNLQCL